MKAPTMNDEISEIDEYLTVEEVAKLLKLGVPTLNKYRGEGGGPPFVLICGRVRYPRKQLNAYIAARTYGSTSEYKQRAVSNR